MSNKNLTSLHIVEPTLTNLSGHEYGYVSSLIDANKNFNFDLHIWLGKLANNKDVVSKLLSINKYTVNIHKHFIRSIIQLQKFFLYYKFLKNNQPFYVCTSGIIDLLICEFLIKILNIFNPNHTKYGNATFFHFHQFKKTDQKIKKLKKISDNSKENFKILATTVNLAKIFAESGFIHVKSIACPVITPKPIVISTKCEFNKILYAGAARADKGFSLVVDTVIAMQTEHTYLPFVLQVYAPNSNRYDPETLLALTRLQKTANLNHKIRIHRTALTTYQYQELFFGAVCLLVYDQDKYADKFSGVALDAFYSGCPIITVDNTWMGSITKSFNAGIVLQQANVATISAAILEVKNNYSYYHINAKKAAEHLIVTHDPKHSLQAVYDYL